MKAKYYSNNTETYKMQSLGRYWRDRWIFDNTRYCEHETSLEYKVKVKIKLFLCLA